MSIRGIHNERCELCGFTHHFYNEAGSCQAFGVKTFAEKKIEELESKAMSAWVSIGFAPKDKVLDMWGAPHEPRVSESLMMAHELYMRRWTDCVWSPRVKRVSGLLMNLPDGWYFRWFRKSYSDEDADSADGWMRIYPTHYSLPLPGPNT